MANTPPTNDAHGETKEHTTASTDSNTHPPCDEHAAFLQSEVVRMDAELATPLSDQESLSSAATTVAQAVSLLESEKAAVEASLVGRLQGDYLVPFSDLPNSLKTIEGNAFLGCSSLTSVILPDSLKIIGGNAFRGCSSLTSVVLPDSLVCICNDAFLECTSLASVSIPPLQSMLFRIDNCGFSSSCKIDHRPDSVSSELFSEGSDFSGEEESEGSISSGEEEYYSD